MTQLKRSLVYGLLSLPLILGACSKSEPKGVDNTTEEGAEYETVTLSMGSDMEGDNESARLGFYEGTQNGKPFAKLSFGVDGQKHKVHTAIYSINNRVVYKGYLDWTITRNGTRLEYNGPLKINKIRLSDPSVDDRLRLVAIPTNTDLAFRSPTSVFAVFNQDAQIAEVSASGTATPSSMPYVMSTTVKRKGLHGVDSRTLVNADLATAKFKPKGNLVRFRVTNSTNQSIRIHGVGIPPYYAPSMSISTTSDRMEIEYVYESSGAQRYIELNPTSVVTLQPGRTSSTLQYWTPIQHPNNEKSPLPTTETAPNAPLFVYIFKTSDPGTRYLQTERLSTATTNAQRDGKQLYYHVNVTELKNKF